MSSAQPNSGQPQVIVPSSVPNQQTIIIQICKPPGNSECGRINKTYKARAAAILACLQIFLGCASIVFNSLAISFGFSGANVIGHGIFSPVLWFIAGAFGIASSCSKAKCPIITCMVMSIFSAVTIVYYVPLTALTFNASDKYNYEHSKYVCDTNAATGWDNCGWVYYDDPQKTLKEGYYAVLAMDICMLITAIMEGIVAILASVLCCQVLYCGSNRKPQSTEQVEHLVKPTGASRGDNAYPIANNLTSYDEYSWQHCL